MNLGSLDAKLLLVVNTASECSYTKQYEALQALHRHWMGKGLAIIAVPSNDFGGQEPGSNSTIANFCRQKYSVNFPVAEKCHVIGPDAHDFYKWVAKEKGEAHVPKWNFHKYLIDAHGKIIEAWPSRASPDDDIIVKSISSHLT